MEAIEPHVLANLFPQMAPAEFAELKADIDEKGLNDPVWLYENQILDGRHRYRACYELGKDCVFQEYIGTSPASFVVSSNLRRRDLNSGQRAAISLHFEPYLAMEAKERQRQSGGDRKSQEYRKEQEQEGSVEQLIAQGFSSNTKGQEDKRAPQSRDNAAKATGSNRQYVSDAKRLQQAEPALLEQVRTGEISMTQAMREFNKRNFIRPAPIQGKYRVFYADPPWAYGSSGVIGEGDNYGRAERHYPTMSIAQLCDMGQDIKSASDDDAVLFLWVTSPLLEECFPVIRAWGFGYKSLYVWDKKKHNFAHYSSMRHELLLVCTKGSCVPDGPAQQFNSVVSLERSNRHSEKPEYFRQLIDELYPHGNRIELFARKETANWEAWGNQAIAAG